MADDTTGEVTAQEINDVGVTLIPGRLGETPAEKIAQWVNARLRAERDKGRAEVESMASDLAEIRAKHAELREHTLNSNPAMRTLHANAVAYIDAVAALSEVRHGAPLSTTLGWLIRQGHLVPAEAEAANGDRG